MKKVLLLSCLSACIMLTSCSMGNNETTEHRVPQGGDPAVTAPSKDMDIVDEVQKVMQENDAKKLVLERVPGAKEEHIREWKIDNDDGKQVYEGKIVMDQTEYEFEIDALTGEIMTWETGAVND